jgi:hypothetical protein
MVSNIDSFTISIRYQWLSKVNTPQSLLALGDAGQEIQNNDMRLQLESDDITIITQTGSGDTHVTSLSPSPETHVWHNMVVVFEDGIASVYLDGSHVDDRAYTTPETMSDDLLIGNNACCGHQFVGMIDDLAIYSESLSPEVATYLSEYWG